MKAYKLTRNERLKDQVTVQRLFTEGRSFYVNPFRVLYLLENAGDPIPTRVLFSVSKRKIKTAVSRNKVKRRMREAYRQNKHILTMYHKGQRLTLGLVYNHHEVLAYALIREKIILILQRLSELNERSAE